jgi:ribonuclease P protein component
LNESGRLRPYESLRGRREFALAMRRGNLVSTGALNVRAFFPRGSATSHAKVGIVITKKVGGAVVRNAIRRRCKAVLDELMQDRRGLWLAVTCAPPAAGLRFGELREQLTRAVERCATPRAHKR